MRRDWHQIRFEFHANEFKHHKHHHVSLMVMDQPVHWFWVVSWCKQSAQSGSTHFLVFFIFPICTGTILLHFYGLPFSPFGHGSVTYPNSLAPTLPSFLDCSWLQLSSAFEVATAQWSDVCREIATNWIWVWCIWNLYIANIEITMELTQASPCEFDGDVSISLMNLGSLMVQTVTSGWINPLSSRFPLPHLHI